MKKLTKLLLCIFSLMGGLKAMKTAEPQEALFKAAKEGNTVGIIAAKDQGADINATSGPEKETALHIAAEKGQKKSVEELLKLEANINQQDASGKTALHKALGKLFGKESHFETAKSLLDRKPNLTLVDNDGNTILHAAVTPSGHYFYDTLLDKLQKQQDAVNINAQNKVGKTALQKAVETNDLPIVQALLKHKADLKPVDAEGNTVLHSALKDNLSKQIIDALLEKDPSLINNKNKTDRTPLQTFVETMNTIEEHATQNKQNASAQELLKNAQEVGEMLSRTRIDQANKEKALTIAQGSLTKKTIEAIKV